jgi:hypothetical protein
MECAIELIARKPITINKKCSGLNDILEKIILWIELVIEYDKLFEENFIYKNINFSQVYDNDFSYEMRLASLGTEYKNWKILPGLLHEYGESWSFEELILTSNTGIVEWYCNKFGFSHETYLAIGANIDVQLLGAFYHRMKIILENISKIMDFFSNKQIYGMFDINKLNKLLSNKELEKKYFDTFILCKKIKEFELIKDELFEKYVHLEKVTDLSQLVLFILIKQNNKLVL